MTEQEITIKFDRDRLSNYTDEFIAQLWHVAQANPAPFGDYRAGDLVAKLSWEIIRRWLAKAPVQLYHHQPLHNYYKALTALATYQPPEGVRLDAGQGADNDAWHEGTWVPKQPKVPGE